MSAVIPSVTKLVQGVIRILGCNPGKMTLQGTNTYLIGTGRRRILLDTSEKEKPDYIDNLKKVLQDEQAEIETILVTHWHRDHIGGVPDILRNIKRDIPVYKYPRNDCEEDYDFPVSTLEDGQIIQTEGATLQIVHTPGHTTDHIVIVVKETGALFSGDCILGEGTSVFSDLHDYILSLKKILEIKPSVVYPGHGPVVEDPAPKIQFYIDHRQKRENEILDVLRSNAKGPLSVEEIVLIIYKDLDPQLHAAAGYNVLHHLQKLCKERLVVANDDKYSAMAKEHL